MSCNLLWFLQTSSDTVAAQEEMEEAAGGMEDTGRRGSVLDDTIKLNASRFCYQVNRSHVFDDSHHLERYFLISEVVPLLLFRTSSRGAKATTHMLVRQTQNHFAICFGLLLGDFLQATE